MSDASGLKATLRHDLHDALRAQDRVRAGTLRMALTGITNAEVAGTEHRELDDEDVLKVLAKEAKKRREAADAYRGAGRAELAEQEEAELEVLQVYLPEQLGEEEIARIVDRAVDEVGATSMAQMGQVMKIVQGEVAGRADGGAVAAMVKARLAG